MASTVILKAAGLVTSPNQLDLPDGSLTEANNIIIKRDGVVESRRGFKLHGNPLPLSTDRVKQLEVYRGRILRHYDSVLQFDSTGNGDFVAFAESFTEAVAKLRFKAVESSGNMYLTSDKGIKKISSTTGDGLTDASIQDAGGIKAVDLTSEVQYTYKNQTGFLPQDSTVAYRALWNIEDINGNLIQGSPSQRSIATNDLGSMLVQDFLRLLQALDNINDTTANAKQRIQDQDYFQTLKLPISASPSEIRQGLVDLSTKLDTDIEYGNTTADTAIALAGTNTIAVDSQGVATYTKSPGTAFTDYLQAGSEITLSGMTNTNAVGLNGDFTITSVTADTFTFQTEVETPFSETVNGAPVLNSNEYGAFTTPTEPNIPATNDQLVQIQLYMSDIIQRLQAEPDSVNFSGTVIDTAKKVEFIDPLDITTTATVKLKVTIPEGITTDHFIQLYRSAASQAVGVEFLDDKTPSDELKLVYEAFVTDADLVAGYIDILDETPNEFRGANLYTNPSTGEGIAQANDIPPFAKDINRFRNVVFYANTKTRHRFNFNIIGVEDLIDDANAGNNPKLSIVSADGTQDYSFVLGASEQYDLTIDSIVGLDGTSFDLYSAKDRRIYRFYYSDNAGTVVPAVTNEILVKITIPAVTTQAEVASKTSDAIATYANDFNSTYTSPNTFLTVTNVEEGESFDPILPAQISISNHTQGIGEDADNGIVLISSVTSPAQAVDLTARSLVRVINNNLLDSVYAYYLSGVTDIPGKILLESRELNEDAFYVISSSTAIAGSFSPDIGPEHLIQGIVTGDETTNEINIVSHGYNDGDQVVFTLSDATTTPAGGINGVFTVQRLNDDNIRLPIQIDSGTAVGTASSVGYAQVSENEEKANRIYYSKYQQPESVPIVNYFDVGRRDQDILRIMPLRDSLFVFKVDGVYRISGEVAPFNVQLFDSSTKLIADDTVSVVDNNIYCWTEQGIAAISESNVSIISRVIDQEILKIGSSNFTEFRYATWGTGYESDNAYMVFTTKDKDDTTATIGYRYSTLTNTWTNIDKTPVCGAVSASDDKMYFGASDTNYIEIERKDFDRTDYADRELDDFIGIGDYVNGTIILTDVSNYSVGDVVTQDQTLTIYQYNNLLAQLDNDTGTSGGYETALTAVAGDNLRTKIEDLAAMLDADGLTESDYAATIASQAFAISNISVNNPTLITTAVPHNMFSGRLVTIAASDSNPSINGTHEITVIDPTSFTIDFEVLGAGTTGAAASSDQNFDDIEACYNAIVNKLNSDAGLDFNNYPLVDNRTLQETPIESINTITKTLTLRDNLDFVPGDILIYKSIPTSYTYAPNTMGDPLGLKHLREAQMLFEDRALTSATMEFATDLFPQFESVAFDLDGNGMFGGGTFGTTFFGGTSNSIPFRTYIPRNSKYCTYIRVRFTHNTAREDYAIFATTLTGEVGISTRAYR